MNDKSENSASQIYQIWVIVFESYASWKYTLIAVTREVLEHWAIRNLPHLYFKTKFGRYCIKTNAPKRASDVQQTPTDYFIANSLMLHFLKLFHASLCSQKLEYIYCRLTVTSDFIQYVNSFTIFSIFHNCLYVHVLWLNQKRQLFFCYVIWHPQLRSTVAAMQSRRKLLHVKDEVNSLEFDYALSSFYILCATV